jgi:hypothetical protein
MTSTATGPTDQEPLHCLGCGYDLRGLDEKGDCPECGKPISETINIPDVWITHPDWLNLQIRLLWCLVGLAVFSGIVLVLDNAIISFHSWSYGINSFFFDLDAYFTILNMIGPMGGVVVAFMFRSWPNPHAPADGPENRWRRALPYLAILAFVCDRSTLEFVNFLDDWMAGGSWSQDWVMLQLLIGILGFLCALLGIAYYCFLYAKWPRLTKPEAPNSIPYGLFIWTIFMIVLGFLSGAGLNTAVACAFTIVLYDLCWWLKDKQLLKRCTQYYYLITILPIVSIVLYVMMFAFNDPFGSMILNWFAIPIIQLALLAVLFLLIRRVTMRVRELRRQAVA